MITIIVIFKTVVCLPDSPIVTDSHSLQFRLEVIAYFLFRYATDGGIFRQETDIGEVVKHGEQGYLCELGDARDEHKLLILVIRFQYREHLPVRCSTLIVLWRVPGVLKRSVILIDKYGDPHPCLLVGRGDDGMKTVGKLGCRLGSDGIFLLILLETQIQI